MKPDLKISNGISLIIVVLMSLSFIDNLKAQSRFKNTIYGQVTDAKTGEPLFNVNVFLANTTRGAATDKEGYYLIKNIPPGAYDLIFSMMGYELEIVQVQFIETKSLKIDMKLRPWILPGKEIEVIASIPREWKKNLKRFISAFLGESENAKKCKIINPEVLDFQVDGKARKFTAFTDSILVIENRSLGYRLHIILDAFRISKDSLIYSTYPRYEELVPRTEKELDSWKKIRQKTYHGSFRHFLSALARDVVEQEKFVLFAMDGRRIDSQKLNMLPDTSLALKWLYLAEPIEVVYKGLSHSGEGKYIEKFRTRLPSSYIHLTRGYALIDTFGNVLTKFAFVHSGYWYNQRIADMLPFDYMPDYEDKN